MSLLLWVCFTMLRKKGPKKQISPGHFRLCINNWHMPGIRNSYLANSYIIQNFENIYTNLLSSNMQYNCKHHDYTNMFLWCRQLKPPPLVVFLKFLNMYLCKMCTPKYSIPRFPHSASYMQQKNITLLTMMMNIYQYYITCT